MKVLFIGIYCALFFSAQAQTTTTKSYPAKAGQHVELKFDYPKVKVTTWDKDEVSITAHVNINDDENDDAFVLEQQEENGTLVINSRIKDMDKLPRRYTIMQNGKKTIFRTKAELQEAQKNGGVRYTSEGTDIDVVLEIKIPRNCQTTIKSIYGIVELTDYNATISVDATYGGIDATLVAAHTGKVKATTNYGRIYSNLDLKLTDHAEHDFFNSITAEPGNGPSYQFTSTYGKIYLRKP